MPLFPSSREGLYWLYSGLVLLAIIGSLVFGSSIQGIFQSQDVQAAIFLSGMVLVAASILFHALFRKSNWKELAIWLGLAATYLMFFLRLGISERSHLIEYSILAIFIHRALQERFKEEKDMWRPAIGAFLISAFIGVLDEGLQYFLPKRVFDPVDILFNAFASLMAIGASVIIACANKFRKKA